MESTRSVALDNHETARSVSDGTTDLLTLVEKRQHPELTFGENRSPFSGALLGNTARRSSASVKIMQSKE